MQQHSTREIAELFVTLTRTQASLSLDSKDLCFLVALHVYLDGTGQGSLSEEALRDVFERTWEHVEPDATNIQKAATERIGKLRDQRLLNRLAASRYSAESDYVLSSLAQAIIAFFYEDERLTRETLDVLTATLISELISIRQALDSGPADQYGAKVVQPLRVSVGTLLEGIARRQQGLDRQQEKIRDVVADKLQGASELVVDRCCEVLEDMGNVLRELNGVLIEGCTRLNELVEHITQSARTKDAPEVLAAAFDIADKIGRVAGWGQSRLDTWTQYYEHVHRHIRMVISLDPNRALSQALRRLMLEGPAWSLRFCAPERYAWLQEPEQVTAQTRVSCPEREHKKLEEVEAAPQVSPVEQLAIEALKLGPARYLDVADNVLAITPREEQFDALGELARHLARLGVVEHPRDRTWLELDTYEVQDWKIHPR